MCNQHVVICSFSTVTTHLCRNVINVRNC